jgi:hypothetical protein
MMIDLPFKRPTACVTGRWAGVDNVWKQRKPEARKLLENGGESHLSSARFVRRFLLCKTRWLKKRCCHQHAFDFSEFKTGRRIIIRQ